MTKSSKIPFVLALFFSSLPLLAQDAAKAPASSPVNQLQQLTTQLQQSQGDQALRETIIALALTLNPKPATPDPATMAEGAAEYAFRNAKGNSDFSDAAKQYEKALLLAPWLAADYFNCGIAHEKAGENKEAIRNFNLYLLAAPTADDAQAVKKRIGGLQYVAQKAEEQSNAAAKEARLQAEEAARREAEIRIGAHHGGGIIFYIDGTGQHGLIGSTVDLGTNPDWYTAVRRCRDYRGGGNSDWFMPAIEQWKLLFSQRNVFGGLQNAPGYAGASWWSSTQGKGGAAYSGVATVVSTDNDTSFTVLSNTSPMNKGSSTRAIRTF